MQGTGHSCNSWIFFQLQQVGTNLTDLTLKKKKVTLRELGGCMGPIWPSYFEDCSSVIVCSYIIFYLIYINCFYPHRFLHVNVFTVYGGLSEHCTDIFIMYPTTVSALCWHSTQCFRAYSVEQEVTFIIPARVIIITITQRYYNSTWLKAF